jgi:hypothetical protein
MSVTISDAIAELTSASVADPRHHLKPGGRDEVTAEIERRRSRGMVAHVLVVDRGDPLEQLLSAWDALGYDAQRDLLLVYDTHDSVARGWGLAPDVVARELATVRQYAGTTFAHVLVAALGRLADARLVHARKNDEHSLAWPIVGGIGAAFVGTVIALAIRRRSRLAQEGLANLREASGSAERAYADLILACEELSSVNEATEIQLRAAELKKRMDEVIRRIEQAPTQGTDPVEIGRIRQLEDEIAVLRSTVLQKENR